MKYAEGPYIKRDLKRIRIRSASEDIENHFKIIRGRITEIKTEYSVPLANFLYKIENIDNTNINVYFFKDRCATTNPKLSPKKGLRIIFALYKERENIIRYIPFIIFLAKEEGKYYQTPNNKKYNLTSSNFKHIIKAKLKYI